jgi:hypothetical protein
MRPIRPIAFAAVLTPLGCSMVQDLGGNLDGGDADGMTDAGVVAEGAGPDTTEGPETGDATRDAASDAASGDGMGPDMFVDADAITTTDATAADGSGDADAPPDAAPDAPPEAAPDAGEAGSAVPDGGSPDAADGEAGPPATCSTGLLSWARVAAGHGASVAARPGGSVFVAGDFSGTSNVFVADGGTATLTSRGSRDVYLALYGADGTLAWIESAGGVSVDDPGAVAVAPGGGALMTGAYGGGSATFGAGQAMATTLTSNGGYNGFVANYDGAGTLLWAKGVPGLTGQQGNTHPQGIGVGADGTSIVVGTLWADATFGPGETGETTLSLSAGVQTAGFIARYAADGHLIWAKAVQGGTTTEFMGVALAADGSSYVTGGFGEGTTVFGKGEPNETSYTSAVFDLLLAHYNADGTLAWVKRTVPSGPDASGGGIIARSIALAPEGALLVSGDVAGPEDFGPGEAHQTTVTATNDMNTDMFVASFDLSGALRWVRHAGASPSNPYQMSAYSLAAVPGAGAAVTGDLVGSVTFGAGESRQTTLVGSGAYDGYVARYEADGTLAWAKLLDSDGGEAEGYGISSAGDCSLFVTGFLYNTGTFGIGEPGATTLTAEGGTGFVLRLQP